MRVGVDWRKQVGEWWCRPWGDDLDGVAHPLGARVFDVPVSFRERPL